MARRIVGQHPDKRTPGMFGKVPGLPIYEEVEEVTDEAMAEAQQKTERVGKIETVDRLGQLASMRQDPGTRVYAAGDGSTGIY